MADDRLKTLFHPFDAGILSAPEGEGAWLFFGAEPGFIRPSGFATPLRCIQGFKPAHDALSKSGLDVRSDGEGFDPGHAGALVLLGRHRGQNENRLAEAARLVRPGGLVVVAGGKTDGADSLRKRLAKAIPDLEHLSKHHGVVFWFRRPDDRAAEYLVEPAAVAPVDGRFHTAPGMFSHDRVDEGSRLLADCLPPDLKGHAADFCAGWGYLAAMLIDHCPDISGVDLYEADHDSLQAARLNLAGRPAGFHWHDLAGEPVAKRYDVIVMNPPFHTGRRAEPALGLAMIASAAKALKPGGRLFMVANRQLPYEKALATAFSAVSVAAETGIYKVFEAKR